tara:strand:- start:524 stop:1384 length:861 start_codon:yes stop_codon:yes gene_type:complete
MELFLNYAQNSKVDLYELQKDIDRLIKISNVETFTELIPALTNFSPIIEKILDKYTLATTLKIMENIKIIFKFYKCDTYFLYRFVDEYNALMDLKENKDLYTRYSLFDIRNKIEGLMDWYIGNKCCFTQYRNYLVLVLFLFEFPLRHSRWCNIKMEYSDFDLLEEFDDYPIYLVIQDSDFYFIFNDFSEKDNSFMGQKIHKITNKKIYKLLSKFSNNLSNNKTHFITNKSGKPITSTNLSNAITNFSRETFGKSITMNNMRIQWTTYKKLIVPEENLELLNKLYSF